MSQVLWRSKPFESSDLSRVLRLRSEVFREPGYDSKRWQWQYEKNPQGRAFITLAVDQKSPEKLAGNYSLIAYQVRNGSTSLKSCQSLDTFTSADYRNQGVFVGLAEESYSEAKANGVNWVFGFPNPSSSPGFLKKLKFVTPFSLYHYQRPLKFGFLRKRIKGAGVLSLLDKLSLTFSFPKKCPWEFSRCETVPNDWQTLSGGFEKRFPISIKRDPAYVRWRFFHCPDRKYDCFQLTRDGLLRGFVALRLSGEDRATGHIAEIIAADDESWRALIRASLAQLLKMGAESAIAYLNPSCPVTPIFTRSGFLRRGEGTPFILRQLKESQNEFDMNESRNWYISGGDTDYF